MNRVTDLGAPSRAAFIPHWCKDNFGELCPSHKGTKLGFVLVAMPLVHQGVQHIEKLRRIASRVSDKLLIIINVVHNTDINGTGIIPERFAQRLIGGTDGNSLGV